MAKITRSGQSSHNAPETIIRTYTNPQQYRKDAEKLSKQGWRVINTVENRPRAGCARILTLGLMTVVFPPKPEIVVTYARD